MFENRGPSSYQGTSVSTSAPHPTTRGWRGSSSLSLNMTSTSSLHCLKRGSRPAAGCCACVARARACVLCVCGVSDYRCGQPAARPCTPRSYPRWARGRLFSHLLARTLSLAARRKPLLPSTASLSHWVQPVRVCQSRRFGGSIASFRGIACSRREGRPPRAHSRSACCMGVESIRVGGGYGRKVNVGVGGEVSAIISCSERMVKCICEKGTMVSGVRCRTLVLVFGVG